jgi:hypothetical protein
MPRKLKIYLAGPYSADTAAQREQNVAAAMDAALIILRKGHWPFIPHLTHYVDLRARELGTPLGWSDYIAWDLEWLAVADALLYLASSPGADLELRRAQELGKVIFRSVDEIPSVRYEYTVRQ